MVPRWLAHKISFSTSPNTTDPLPILVIVPPFLHYLNNNLPLPLLLHLHPTTSLVKTHHCCISLFLPAIVLFLIFVNLFLNDL